MEKENGVKEREERKSNGTRYQLLVSESLGESIFSSFLSVPLITSWRGLSSSDDILWAGIYLLNLFNATGDQ